jgi:predicted RecB family endonuclease
VKSGRFVTSGQHKVKEVDGRVWKKTNHDLDFLIVRDGVRYGVEVKNQLGYIDQTEFQIKLAMCIHFGIRPMFVTRAMPKNYIYDVMRAGGFSLLTDNQNYPLLADDLARRVRSTLNLPVGVIQQFPVTALDHLHVDPAGSPRKRVASPRAGSENQGFFNRY